jgi:hypothetical protein
MSDNKLPPQALLANSRTVVEATYLEPELPKFAGNPCIEALPKINAREQALDLMQRLPEYSDEMRLLPANLRTHMAMDVLHFFQPLSVHLKLEGMVSRMIRDGYLSRNPLDPAHSHDIKTRLNHFKQFKVYGEQFTPTGCGFTICGMSGVGKTTGLIRSLNLYPQTIIHTNYKGSKFTRTQFVWLILECPKDGSTKGLCTRFFKTIDYVMGGTTQYPEKYGKETRSTHELMDSMANVAAIHQLGVLVIDEIQYLNVAKSGGAEEMLNFFVDLVNTIGLPVIIVGTYDAIPLLMTTFRQVRRGSGQGDLVWDPLPFDADWQLFAEDLWEFQYVQNKCSLTEELSSALHEISYGIVDLANRIYLAAQVRAIENGSESITEGLLRSAYRDDFRLVSHIIETLKTGNELLIEKIRDIHPPPILPIQQSTIHHSEENILSNEGDTGSAKNIPSSSQSNADAGPAYSVEGMMRDQPDRPKPKDGSSLNLDRSTKQKKRQKPKKLQVAVDSYEEKDLRGVIAHGISSNPPLDAYKALLNEGYIKNSTEFFKE